MYSDEVDLDEDIVMDVLYLAKKYMLPKLTTRCRRYAKHCLDASNACTLYEKAMQCAEDDIIVACLEVFRNSSEDVFESPDFLRASRQSMEQIFDLDVLSVDEEGVWEACRGWAIAQMTNKENKGTAHATVRKQLGTCFHKIQFPKMSLKAFTQSVVQSKVLTKDETCQFYECMVMADDKENSVAVPKGFSDERRYRNAVLTHTPVVGKEEKIVRFSPMDYKHRYLQIKVDFNVPATKSLRLRYIMFELQYKTQSGSSGLKTSCFLEDEKENVLIGGVPHLACIGYVDTSTSRKKTCKAYFILDPVDVIGPRSITYVLRSDISFSVSLNYFQNASILYKDTGIFFNSSTKRGIPFSAIGFTLCPKQE